MRPRRRRTVLTVIGLVLWAGCGDQETIGPLPLAEAGFDRVVNVGTEVLLDGRGSADPDARELTFLWQLLARPEGSSTVLVAAETAEPRITPDIAGTYLVSLVVDNGRRQSVPDRLAVRARGAGTGNRPPVARVSCPAGNCTVAHGSGQLRLNGNQSSDPDGDPLTYAWRQITSLCATECPLLATCTPVTSPVTWVDATTVQSPLFTAPDAVGDLVFKLTVSDDELMTGSACLVVVATNNVPIADACTTPEGVGCVRTTTVEEGVAFNLYGERSNDPDAFDESKGLSYAWVAVGAWPDDVIFNPAGGAAMNVAVRAGGSLAGTTATFRLTVSDGYADSAACIAPATVCGEVQVIITDVSRNTNDVCYFDSECTTNNCDSVPPAAGNCRP